MNSITINEGDHFSDGNATFNVYGKVKDKPTIWNVLQSIPGSMTARPRIVEMSEDKIKKIIEEKVGNHGVRQMTTVGYMPGERNINKCQHKDSRKALHFHI